MPRRGTEATLNPGPRNLKTTNPTSSASRAVWCATQPRCRRCSIVASICTCPETGAESQASPCSAIDHSQGAGLWVVLARTGASTPSVTLL
jgi:hypothetical protein